MSETVEVPVDPPTVVEVLTGQPGPQGEPGTPGTNGTNGTNGTDGADGDDGESPELRVDSGFIQWKLPSDVAWTNLVALSVITGPAGQDGEDGTDGANGGDGREVEIQSNGTHIQWRYVGDVSWTNIVALSTLQGPAGTNGTNGADGEDGAPGVGVPTGGTTGQVLAKNTNTDYDTEWIDPPEGGGGDLAIAEGSAMNPHTSAAATRNASLPKNFWQCATEPDNWVDGDEWISA